MKIIEITGEPILHGGQERFIANLIGQIGGEAYRIDVLTPYICENPAFCKLVEDKGGKVTALQMDFQPGKSRRMLFQPTLSFLRGKGYDAAHIHSGSISALAYLAKAAKQAGIRKIIVHSHSTGYPSLKHQAIRFVFGQQMKGCVTNYLACSEEAGKTKYLPSVVRDKLVVIRNGIDTAAFAQDKDKRKEIRKALSIPESSVVIGHVGRFSAEKNHGFLIELFDKVHQEKPDSFLLLVGDGELADIVRAQVREKELEGSVIFTGNVENVQDYYQAMDVFILPSIYEGFSYVALEAQAAGLPCLLSDGVPEIVSIGKNVCRLPLENQDEWVRQCMGMAGEKPVDNLARIREAGFDIGSTAAQIREIYDREQVR